MAKPRKVLFQKGTAHDLKRFLIYWIKTFVKIFSQSACRFPFMLEKELDDCRL